MKKQSFFISNIFIISFFCLTIAAPIFVPSVSSEAFAAMGDSGSTATDDSNILVNTMCNALNIVTGSAGKAFAAFAIISIGIGFFTGKVSWGLMIGVAAGIAAMFGAPSIVSAITGQSTFNCK